MTIETHGMRFELDASNVAKGFRDYKSAVEGIFSSLDKFEAKVNKTMKGVESAASNKAALSAFRKSVEGFSKIDIDTTAAKRLSALSAAMNGFKAPSAAQAQNTRKFFTSLSGLPDLSQAFRTLKALGGLKDSLAGFKAPPASQAKNLREFANAVSKAAPALRTLNGIRGVSGIANELASISIALRNLKVPSASHITNLGNFGLALRHLQGANITGAGQMMTALHGISTFKAPSAAAIRNLVNFANALHQIKPPQNSGAIAASMMQIANAANAANASLGGFRGNLGAFNPAYGRFNAGTHQARLQMMGLQNAFSGTFQVGSLLRTLLGSLTIGELGRKFFEATNAASQFKAMMGVLSDDAGFAADQLNWVNATAVKFGMDVKGAETGFGKISIAAHKAGMDVMQTRGVFEGFSTAMLVLGTSAERQNDVWLAMQQVMNKGYLSAEELNQQLNEHLPGAMGYATEMANKMGVSLQTALKKKMLDAADVASYFAKRMKEDFGPAYEKAMNRPGAQMMQLRGNFFLLMQAIGEAGASDAFVRLLKNINGSMEPEKVQAFAEAVGQKLAKAVDKLSEAFSWLRDNWDQLKGPLGTALSLLGKWMVLSAALQIGRSIATPIFTLATAYQQLVPHLQQALLLTRSLRVAQGAQLGNRASQIIKQAPVPASANPANLTGGYSTLYNLMTKVGTQAGNVTSKINLTSIATSALARIATGLGIAYASGMKAAEDSNVKLTKVTYSTGEIIRGAWLLLCDNMRELWAWLADNITSIWDSIKGPIGVVAGAVYDAASNAFIGIAWIAESIVRGIINLFQGMGRAIGATLSQIGKAGGKLFEGDFQGAIGEAAKIGAKAGGAFSSAFDDMVSFDTYKKNVGKGFGAIHNGIADAMNAAGRRSKLEDIMNAPLPKPKLETGELPVPPARETIDDETANGKKKKGRDPAKLAEQAENAVDQLMKKLEAADPVGKLYSDFVKNITDEAHILLSKGGYDQFAKEVAAGSASAIDQTNALIKVLQSGSGLNQKTVADLKARYGVGVEEMVGLLESQLAAYQSKIADATIKSVDSIHKGIIDARKAMDEFDPVGKVDSETNDKMLGIGKMFMSEGDLKAWRTGMVDGTKSVSMSFATLRDAVTAAADPQSKQHQLYLAMTRSGVDLNRVLEGLIQNNKYLKNQAEEANTFGATLLRQKREETMLMGLSTEQAEIMKAVQSEVNDQLAKNNPVRAEQVKLLKDQLTAEQALANQMARNKEFFENNGVRSYVNDLKGVGAAVNDLDKNFLQSLEDQLFNLGTTGKFSFKAIFDTIQQGLIRFAAQDLTKSFTSMLFSKGEMEGGTPSIFGGLFGKGFGLEYGPEKGEKLGTKINPMYVAWAGDYERMGVSTKDGSLINGPEKRGQVFVGNEPTGNMTDPIFVRSADPNAAIPGVINANGGLPGAPGTSLGDGQSVTGAIDAVTKGGPGQDATTKAATSFGDTITGMLPMIGMMFAGSFKSPIARIGMMFLMMMMTQINKAGATGGGGGGGGILGSIMSLFGGGTPGAKEGGIVGSFVNSYRVSPMAFAGAPHYAEGTPNTSGGIPAILHDNEAVIPLSRGRKVPVELTNGSSGGNSKQVNVQFNVTSPDADTFRKSRSQIIGDMHAAAGRAFYRDNR